MDISVSPLPQLPNQHLAVAGEAFIYVDPRDHDVLIKVYHDGNSKAWSPKTGEHADRLIDLLTLGNGVSPSQSWRLSTSFAWPQALFGASINQIDGIAMKRASKNFFVEYTSVAGVHRSTQNLAFLGDALTRPIITRAPYPPMDFETRVEIAFELLLSMRVVWEMGFRYCDYSENNILWAFEPSPKVFVLDTESCRRPGVYGNRSNGWHPRPELGHTIEADRSQCALAVWRIIVGDIGVTPTAMPQVSPGSRLDSRTVALIKRLWDTGDEAIFLQLVDDLRSYRGQKFTDNSFEEAVDTQFARIVFDYAPLQPTPQQQEILDRARRQLDLESEINALEPRLRRFKLNRAIPVQGFEFDIATANVQVPVHQDSEMVRNLALEGEFEYLADMFATVPNCIPVNTVATRAIQTALAACGPGALTSVPVGGSRQRYEWVWPGASFVNCARVRILSDSGDVLEEAFAPRRQYRAGVTFPVDVAYPQNSRIEVSYGLATQRGERVFSPFGASAPIVVAHGGSRSRVADSSAPIGLVDRPTTPIPPRPPSTLPQVAPNSWSPPAVANTTSMQPHDRSQRGLGNSLRRAISRVFRR